MANNLINLDLLRSESQKVTSLGKEFEVGYIPSGLAIPLIENHNKNIKRAKKKKPTVRKAFKGQYKNPFHFLLLL